MSEASDCIRNVSLAAGASRAYRPNGYLRVVAAALSLRSDGERARGSGSFFSLARKYCAIATGEPNCDLMSQVAAVITRPDKALAFAAFLSEALMRCWRNAWTAYRSASSAYCVRHSYCARGRRC